MTILDSRINYAATKLGTLAPEWLVGNSYNTKTSALRGMKGNFDDKGRCYVYTVRVESLNLPLTTTQYYTTPMPIEHRLHKTRVVDVEIYIK